MNRRLHAAVSIARRQTIESLIAPGFYCVLAIALGLAYAAAASFVDSIDSSGFSPKLNPIARVVADSLSGAFGPVVVEKLFAEGPFLLAFTVASIPMLLYLTMSSVFRVGMEKAAGAVELLAYGPADGSSYLMAAFISNVLLLFIALITIAGFLAVTAGLGNLVLGPAFWSTLPVVFLLSLAVFAYGLVCSIITSRASSAVALSIGIVLAFLLILAGTLATASPSVRTVAGVLSTVFQWVSPFFYAELCVRAFSGGNAAGYVGGLGLLLVLTSVLLALGHVVVRARGVRA